MYSNVLKEQRPIRIILPKKYDPGLTDRFDVLYVLDGEWNTSLAEKVNEFLGHAKFIPGNMIIVSIPNYYKNGVNMRERDFTPTSTENKDAKFSWMKSSLNSGGAGNFLLFLKDELVPFVNSKYRANIENNILYGTSSGGLFAIYAYLNEPRLFKSYVTVEPSLWWDKEYINRIASEKLENNKGIRNTLWISSRDGGAQVEMGISGFDSLLKLKAPDGLQWKVEVYPNETHFSAIWKGIYDGLKFTYVTSKTDGTLVNKASGTGK
ncbi:MAG TPA: alpha/beta hydrolase-fold protein [Chryseolinea sp.]|nr:alpha/beta hydrolase-fold protein [Chryseolinea sp.]